MTGIGVDASGYVSLAEAASLLNVSKATLRNWDNQGRLTAIRHPINSYRLYDLTELRKLQAQLGLFSEEEPASEPLDIRSVKRLIGRLHDTLRNNDSQSNIIDRFDELTKLVFSKVMADRELEVAKHPFRGDPGQLSAAIRAYYRELSHRFPAIIPCRFSELKCSARAIAECASVLRFFDFGAAAFDVKGMAYEEVIRNTFDKGDHQQFFTPPHLVDFIVSFCEPLIRGSVCDPAAGTGGFLAGVARQVRNYESLTSIEIDERLSWVAGINMLLHEGRNIRSVFLPNGGTLGPDALPLCGTFDAIVTNPPFGSDYTDRDALESMELGSGRSSRRRGILFIERCHRLLKEGGTLAIIIDEGVLNLGHATDVRRFITSNFDVRAVVSLPESAFMPYATVNTSVLVLTKRTGTDCNRSVFFARADTVGRKANGDDDIKYDRDGNSYLNSDLPSILAAWHAHLECQQPQANPNVYVADMASNLIETAEAHRIDFQYHHPSRWESKAMLEACRYPLVKLKDLVCERNEMLIPARNLAGSIIRYTGLAHIESETGVAVQSPTPADSLKSGVRRYEPGDILFAKMRPNLRKVALASFEEGGYASPECAVLTVRQMKGNPIVDPLLLSVLLRTDFVFGQILHHVAGIGRPRIGTKELREVLVPLPPLDVQARMRAEFLKGQNSAAEKQRESEELLRQATAVVQDSVRALVSGFTGVH